MILPIIIASDQTQPTQSRTESDYPVYMMIGSGQLPSRKDYILLAYLPPNPFELPADHITYKAASHRASAHLYRASSGKIEIATDLIAREKGIAVPILAAFVGDMSEHLLPVAVHGNCSQCEVRYGQQDKDEDLQSEKSRASPKSPCYHRCRYKAHQSYPILSLTRGLGFPYKDIFQSIAPDMLSQGYLGVMKHLDAWKQ